MSLPANVVDKVGQRRAGRETGPEKEKGRRALAKYGYGTEYKQVP